MQIFSILRQSTVTGGANALAQTAAAIPATATSAATREKRRVRRSFMLPSAKQHRCHARPDRLLSASPTFVGFAIPRLILLRADR